MKKNMVTYLLMLLILGISTDCVKNDIEIEILDENLYMGGQYYVATWGDDLSPGTFDKPFSTLQKAVTLAQPGDTVYIRGGVYNMKDAIYYGNYRTSAIVMLIRPRLGIGRSGKAGMPISYFNYPGETPVFDCSSVEPGDYNQGITIENAEYIHLRGLTIRHVRQKEYDGLRYSEAQGIAAIPAANMRFENITVHDIGGRGFYFSSGAWNQWDGPNAPFESDTTMWINCDAYNLFDGHSSSPGNAADGWKAHNYRGNIMYFEGCRAWNYSDDGFDPGGSGLRIINNCWAMSTDKYSGISEKWDIEGNGFKFGAGGNLVIVRNSIAADCAGIGFYNNLELGSAGGQNEAYFQNNLAYKCYSGFGDWPNHRIDADRKAKYFNNLVYNSREPLYEQVQIYRPSTYLAENNTWVPTMEYDNWPGWEYNPDFNAATDDDFISLDTKQLTASRKDDGSLPDITFGKLATNSRMKNAGSNVGMSANPDIGVDWGYLDINMGSPLLYLPNR